MGAKYLTMGGQLQWLVTLVRFDLYAHVATMSRLRGAPRHGHMDRLKTIYAMPSGLKIMQIGLELANMTTPFYQSKILTGHTP